MHFTVDGRNPAPIAMASIPVFTRFCISQLATGAGSLPTTVLIRLGGWESYFMNGLQKGDGVIFSRRNQMVLEDELKHH